MPRYRNFSENRTRPKRNAESPPSKTPISMKLLISYLSHKCSKAPRSSQDWPVGRPAGQIPPVLALGSSVVILRRRLGEDLAVRSQPHHRHRNQLPGQFELDRQILAVEQFPPPKHRAPVVGALQIHMPVPGLSGRGRAEDQESAFNDMMGDIRDEGVGIDLGNVLARFKA